MAADPSAVCDVHGIINLDALSSFFTQITNQINQQNRAIATIQETLAGFVKVEEFRTSFHDVNCSLSSIEDRLLSLREAATSNLKDKRLTAGELAGSNFHQIQKLQEVISTLISRSEVEHQYRELQKIAVVNRQIQKNISSVNQAMDAVSKSQSDVCEELRSHSDTLTRKIDRSELHQLQALVSKVLSYDEFKKNTLLSLQHFEEFEQQTLVKQQRHNDQLYSLTTQTDIMSKELTKTASRRDLHLLAKELQLLSDKVDVRATINDMDEARAQLANLLSILEEHQQHFDDVDTDLSDVHADIARRATLVELHQHLTKADFEIARKVLDDQILDRSTLTQAAVHEQRIGILESNQGGDAKKIAVALQFVEWFTSRGENYDHNIRILDRHLKDLVVSDKTARVHSYFLPGDRVQLVNPAAPIPSPHLQPGGHFGGHEGDQA